MIYVFGAALLLLGGKMFVHQDSKTETKTKISARLLGTWLTEKIAVFDRDPALSRRGAHQS